MVMAPTTVFDRATICHNLTSARGLILPRKSRTRLPCPVCDCHVRTLAATASVCLTQPGRSK